MDKPHVVALKELVAAAGSQTALAAEIADFMERPTFSQQLISYWLANEVVPDTEYWPAIEFIARKHRVKVSRADFWPGLFKSEKAA